MVPLSSEIIDGVPLSTLKVTLAYKMQLSRKASKAFPNVYAVVNPETTIIANRIM